MTISMKKLMLTQDKDLLILQSKYHDSWCLGDQREQVISSHGIDLIHLEYYQLHTRRV